jgi:5-methylcytosine-specific restriction endonuclease McrA
MEMFIQPISGFGAVTRLYSASKNNHKQQYENIPIGNTVFLGTTSAGQPFHRLRNIPDAFFGGITLENYKLKRIKDELVKCTTVKKAVNCLNKYKPSIVRIEKRMLERFEEAAPYSPRMTFPNLLKKWYNEALIKLKLEEFAVIDEIDRISLQLSPETALAVRTETTNCRIIIRDNNPEKRFKRKTVLEALGNIQPKPGEEEIMQSLMETADYLPSSATSENAFVVKYADRSHNEICNRLITPSRVSIDHILADSKGGPNDISNFAVTSEGANNLKSNMWFKKFVMRYPEVIKNCQKNIEFFINIINNGGFKGNQAYPYKVRKRYIQESDDKVKLDLSSLRYTEEEAINLEKAYNKRNKKKGGHH